MQQSFGKLLSFLVEDFAFLYFLLEPCLAGDLYKILQRKSLHGQMDCALLSEARNSKFARCGRMFQKSHRVDRSVGELSRSNHSEVL